VTALFTRLLPDPADGLTAADVAGAVPVPPPHDDGERPFLLVNMITTADGRATIAGRTGTIANRADYELFHALRTRVDAVMVGAETVRVEGYGRMVPEAADREARERAGLEPDPLAVLVTRTARLSPDVGLLAAPENPVVVLTPSPDATLPPANATATYLRGPLEDGVRRLRSELQVRSVLCEGGPAVLGDLLRADLVDELILVIAPKLAAGEHPRTIVSGPGLEPPRDLALLSAHHSGGYLFLRYSASRSARAASSGATGLK
jgi:riboflavin biosynthesis pyrimidine reductase